MRILVLPLLLLLTLATMSPTASAAAEPDVVKSGHSAMWYNPTRSGEGWVLEILPDERALLDWYTYDDEGRQRWLQGVGEIVHDEAGDSIRFSQLYVTHGGHFGPDFNPDDVTRDVVGEATMRFSDCNHGAFAYSAFGQSQTIAIQPIAHTMAAGCPINGIPGEPVKAYAGQSGSWYDTGHSGEGFSLEWLSRDQALLTWYTYDAQGNQYWMIGVGQEQNGQIVFPTLETTTGARFGEAFDPDDVQRSDWGRLTMTLTCAGGSAHYESNLPAFGTGDFTLTRLTQLATPACPYIKPRLSDLYDITWNEIPIAQGTPADPNNIQADSIADDGTIAARKVTSGRGQLALWRPTTGEWDALPRQLSTQPVYISPEGSAVIATDPIVGQDNHVDTVVWRDGIGWEPLSGLVFDRSIHYGVSQDFSHIVGKGLYIGNLLEYPWVWDAEHGQKELPLTEEIRGATPLVVSNDGSVVLGTTLRFPNNYPIQVAVRWDHGGDPRIMHDPDGEELSIPGACNADCSVIFGAGLVDYDPEHAHPGEAWYWLKSGGFGYLGKLPDAAVTSRSYGVGDVTPDGTLAVGGYATLTDPEDANSDHTSRGFIWIQRTGIVSVRSLVTELGIGDDDWGTMAAISVSPDGRKILLSGYHPRYLNEPLQWRAVVLQLTEKSTPD